MTSWINISFGGHILSVILSYTKLSEDNCNLSDKAGRPVQCAILNLDSQPRRFDQSRSAISCNLFHTSIDISGLAIRFAIYNASQKYYSLRRNKTHPVIQIVQQLPVLCGNCSFITVSTTPTNILLLHSVRNAFRLLLQLTALSSLTSTVCHLLPDPLPYHSPSVRPHELSSCTVNDKSYLSDKMSTLYYVSQLQNVYETLAKGYEDYRLPTCKTD